MSDVPKVSGHALKAMFGRHLAEEYKATYLLDSKRIWGIVHLTSGDAYMEFTADEEFSRVLQVGGSCYASMTEYFSEKKGPIEGARHAGKFAQMVEAMGRRIDRWH